MDSIVFVASSLATFLLQITKQINVTMLQRNSYTLPPTSLLCMKLKFLIYLKFVEITGKG